MSSLKAHVYLHDTYKVYSYTFQKFLQAFHVPGFLRSHESAYGTIHDICILTYPVTVQLEQRINESPFGLLEYCQHDTESKRPCNRG